MALERLRIPLRRPRPYDSNSVFLSDMWSKMSLFRARFAVCFAAVLATAFAGCGQDVYESRLAVTSEYFEHINSLNANLASPPVSHGSIAVRVPKQFSPLLDDEETETNEAQPYYLGVELPGLEAAYQGDVLVDVNGQDELRPAFIYVLSNESIIKALAANENEFDPAEFLTELQNRLSGAFGVYIEPGRTGDGSEANVPFYEALPRPVVQGKLQYEPSKQYTAIRFAPNEPLSGFDIPMEYRLYTLEGQQDVKYALLVVIPETARPDENLPERVRMMLETVTTRSPNVRGIGASPAAGGGTSSGPLAF